MGTIERPIGYGSTVQSVCRVEKDSGRERVERDVSSIDQYEPCYIRLHLDLLSNFDNAHLTCTIQRYVTVPCYQDRSVEGHCSDIVEKSRLCRVDFHSGKTPPRSYLR